MRTVVNMTRKLMTAGILSLGLLLSGCGSESSDDAGVDAGSGGGNETSAAEGPEACSGFYEGLGPIDKRAGDALPDMADGKITDQLAFDEVSLIEQRVRKLAETAEGDVKTGLETLNKPFEEVVKQANDSRGDGGSMDFKKIKAVDTKEAQTALDDVKTACEAAGYTPKEK